MRVTIGHVTARVPSPSHHLLLACVHALRHGAFRPLWLCDIAMMLERYVLDWRQLGRSEHQRQAVRCAVGLARELVGATSVGRVSAAPRWAATAVLEAWGAPPLPGDPLMSYLRRPRELPGALRARWPDPLTATMRRGAPFDGRCRLAVQLEDCLVRGAALCRRVVRRGLGG